MEIARFLSRGVRSPSDWCGAISADREDGPASSTYRRAVPELQQLRADHGSAVLSFESDNRAYFAAWISDRGDEFYEHFAEQHDARLAEQRAGLGAYYVLVEKDGSVVGRFNLIFTEGDSAELGYRVAQTAAGRGLATMAVRELCDLAAKKYGLRRIVAATSRQNTASQKVLTNAGFVLIGPAEPADLGGKPGHRYERLLPHD
jgi:ribosomal-protein-alanine N-acetyltransferase